MIELKTKDEIAKIDKASKLTAEIREVLVDNAKPGISTQQLDDIAVREMKKRKVSSVFIGYTPKFSAIPFPANVCLSVNDEIVHGIPKKDKILKDGDIISIDLATRYDGFVGDTAVTVGVGKISDKIRKFLKISEQSLLDGILKSLAGNYMGDIGYAIESYISSHGLHVIREYTGHGIGRELHEEPMVPHFGIPKTGLKLEVGLVFTIEPMICMESNKTYMAPDNWTVCSADRKPAAHFEHTLVVTPDGPVVLTKL